jgi:hypothetical protein
MEKEFVPYELALRMKALGFDEPCLAIHSNANPKTGLYTLNKYRLKLIKQGSQKNKGVKAPLFQQVFRWFREKYRLLHFITTNTTRGGWDIQVIHYNGYKILYENNDNDLKYEEAELACLEKLIKIVETKSE